MAPTDFHLTVLILLRWVHLVSAILWVGLSYFMNFVLSPAARRMEPSLKLKVMPDILDRAFFWLRWGSLVTYLTGWFYLIYKCYGESNVGFHTPDGLAYTTWGQWISVGVILGTVLFVNVWWVIWPAQKKVIAAMRSGSMTPQAQDLAAHAEKVSKINVYLSVPLIFTMASASHLPVMNSWLVAGMLAAGFVLAAHLFMIANRIHKSK